MNQYKDAIYNYAYYFSGSREDAEDLTQETLIKIWRNLDTLRDHPSRRWIMKVTRNHCIEWARASKSRSGGTISFDADQGTAAISPHHIIKNAEREDLKKKIESAVAGLPAHLRETIILREIQEMKYEEISQALEVPINTVKAHIHRGRRLLREQLSAVQETVPQRRCV